MPRATWNGAVLAEAPPEALQIVEGNVYFPPDAVRLEHLRPSDTHSVCSWKGTASYYDVIVDGERNAEAAWYYPDAKPEADHVRGRIAFWHGVTVG